MRHGFAHRCTRRILRCEAGVTAIEFAMIAPMLMLLLFGTVELSLVMYAQSVIEGATSISSRLGKTGYSESGVSREQTILNTLNARAHGLLDTDRFIISAQTYSQFDKIGDEEPYLDGNTNGRYDLGETYTDINGSGLWDEDMGRAGYGNANDVVVYTVTYPWRISTPLVGKIFSPDSIVTLSAAAVVKNEPY